MGKLVCNYYDNETKCCDNEDNDDWNCYYYPDKWTECKLRQLIDEDVLTHQFMEDNYNSDGSVRQ